MGQALREMSDAIPASLSGNASRYVLANAELASNPEQMKELVPDVLRVLYGAMHIMLTIKCRNVARRMRGAISFLHPMDCL